MAESSGSPSPPEAGKPQQITWSSDPAEYLSRTVSESRDFVLRSAPSIREGLSFPFRRSQELLPELKSLYSVYEDAFFNKMKDGLLIACEHPTATCGVAAAAGVLFMRGPRRFLLRHTLGRFQSEETLLVKAEKGLTDLDQAVQLTRNESKKLLERAGYAENAMLGGQTRLRDSAMQIRRLVGDLYKAEAKGTDFVDELCELPGRNALQLRAEVASMIADMKHDRSQLEKRIIRISNLGLPV